MALLIFLLFIVQSSKDHWHLVNRRFSISISKDNGKISSFFLKNHKFCPPDFEIFLSGQKIEGRIIRISSVEKVPRLKSICVEKEEQALKIEHQYILDTISLCWKVSVTSKVDETHSLSLRFSLPVTNNIDCIFDYGTGKKIAWEDFKKVKIYRRDFCIPIVTLFHSRENLAISIIVGVETLKPQLSVYREKDTIFIALDNLGIISNRTVISTIYIIAHENDFRPALDFLLNKYPEYFFPKSMESKITDGWFYQGSVFDAEKRIKEVKNRGVTWMEFHCYFPFYGLYAPEMDEWGLIFDTDAISLQNWERGMGSIRNGYKRVNESINLWHKFGIRVYLYFQVYEAWHQYAQRYFARDITRSKNGNPLPAWKFCNLMNPDPQSEWGRYIVEQAKKVIQKYPTIDGIFYDRMDYHNYDFSHSDGYTTIDGTPAYMLAFALEKINTQVFEIFHRNGKEVWGNGPTSIEVCKGLEGIMAEGGIINLFRLQYLCINRPLVYLPYDSTPRMTEKKLKYALLCGAFPSITYGDSACKMLERMYHGVFELLKNRRWVLTNNPVVVPENCLANIFLTPESNYVVVVVSPEKSFIMNHPFEFNIPVMITITDASKINYLYLLSGDWPGVVRLPFKRWRNKISFSIPAHLATSVIVLTRRGKFKNVLSKIPYTACEIISCAPVEDIYIKSVVGDTVLFYFVNNTGNPVEFNLGGQFIKGDGFLKTPEKLFLDKYELRRIPIFISTRGSGEIRIKVILKNKVIEKIFPFKTCLMPETGDLFYDDFTKGMEKWKIISGAWEIKNGIAIAKGQKHFALVQNKKWKDYIFEVKTRIQGSEDPFVDWLKAYIFFRVQDENNLYRFGIHGDAGVVDMYKCVNGNWIEIASALFEPDPKRWYVLKIRVKGSRISGYIDDERILEVNDETFGSGGIGIGVLEDGMLCEYREVVLKKVN
ncbi:MAG: DUF1080 domain-containing protein [candidate division WOR-3 bacterium]|nr:DUF1080 domain-containing protein [candidate division WOR-3 bacterium]